MNPGVGSPRIADSRSHRRGLPDRSGGSPRPRSPSPACTRQPGQQRIQIAAHSRDPGPEPGGGGALASLGADTRCATHPRLDLRPRRPSPARMGPTPAGSGGGPAPGSRRHPAEMERRQARHREHLGPWCARPACHAVHASLPRAGSTVQAGGGPRAPTGQNCRTPYRPPASTALPRAGNVAGRHVVETGHSGHGPGALRSEARLRSSADESRQLGRAWWISRDTTGAEARWAGRAQSTRLVGRLDRGAAPSGPSLDSSWRGQVRSSPLPRSCGETPGQELHLGELAAESEPPAPPWSMVSSRRSLRSSSPLHHALEDLSPSCAGR